MRISLIILFYTCFLFISCNNNGSSEDQRRIKIILQEFGNEYEIKLESELYIRIKDLNPKNAPITETTAIQLYEMFFWNEDRLPRPSKYIYLNTYDIKGNFIFQISYNYSTKKFIKSFADHY